MTGDGTKENKQSKILLEAVENEFFHTKSNAKSAASSLSSLTRVQNSEEYYYNAFRCSSSSIATHFSLEEESIHARSFRVRSGDMIELANGKGVRII